MTDKQKKILLIGSGVFVVYIFLAAQRIPVETVLSNPWFIPLESSYPIPAADTETPDQRPARLLPFFLGSRGRGHFGYIDKTGRLTVNQALGENRGVSLSADNWAEYAVIPEAIEVRSPLNQQTLTIEGGWGYPLFRDRRIFLINSGQHSLGALDENGGVLWTYDFAAPITALDAANGFVLAGLVNGTVEVLNSQGRRIFFFEPGGSRISSIYGCAISQDGSQLAIISGIDLQRFLLLERYGSGDPEQGAGVEYKVTYHEFLEEGFRRPVHLAFIDGGSRIAFERQGGLGLYDIQSRVSLKLPIEGEIWDIDTLGADKLLFLITAQGKFQKTLIAVRLPGTIILEAPFKSEYTFLGRQDERIYVGGNMTLASFALGKQ